MPRALRLLSLSSLALFLASNLAFAAESHPAGPFSADAARAFGIVAEGVVLRVARLAESADGDIDPAIVSRALDEAYRLAYGRYRSLERRTAGERRWVLSQAVEAGVDVRLWGEAILGPDARWASSLVPHRDIASIAPSAQAKAISDEAALSASRSAPARQADTEAFLRDVIQGAPMPVMEIERFVARIPEGELGALAEILEAVLLSDGAAPQVALALAFAHSRLGFKAKEYAALARAIGLTRRRPDVVFNVLVVHGRMELIRSSADWGEIERLLAAAERATAGPATEAVVPTGAAPEVTAAPSVTEPPSVSGDAAGLDVRTRRFLDISSGSPKGYYALQVFREGDGFRETSRGYDDDALAFHEIATDQDFRVSRYAYQREDQGTDLEAVLRNGEIAVTGTYMGGAVSKSFPTKGLDWVVDQLPYLEAMTRKGVSSKKFLILLVDQPGGVQVMEYQFRRGARQSLTAGAEVREAWKIHWGLTGLASLFWAGADFWHDTRTGDFLKGVIPMPGKGTITYIEER